MRLACSAVLFCCVVLLVVPATLAQKRSVPPVRIEGTYDNLHVGPPESGDLEGMRVMLIDGGGGIYAIVQEAAGGVELPAPAMAEVTVKGNNISFSVKFPGQDEVLTFSGKVSASGLNLRRTSPAEPNSASGQGSVFLKRRKC